ncbi:Piso0_003776 [Millerozyma farinosa CBS 7064]|uniref:Phosphoglycerate mutase n=1 Tax=Pichia sorbitophila (strain ATCC MYA-4447 / BCRC 22081 / CBS 7064 / NBRC 10061 / NRRL Y-12695) TaxID=559304 RepID=G8Y898_PICSO|nr:Piso0_003776 [Millerozyma farinosa CBS 7064]CCE84235.1 Piso0_003776 [Millerozyma farinosa CBS 7064]
MTGHTLIILRHGESEWNHENKFCGWIDIPLSERGRYEARVAGELIKRNGLKPDVVYTSKLTRSIETGNIILQVLGRQWCDVVRTWRLNERHYGAYQGVDKTLVYKQLGPEKYKYVRRDFNGLPPPVESGKDKSIDERYRDIDVPVTSLPKTESLKMVMDRLIPYVRSEILYRRLIEENKTVLIVTHGSVVRSLIKYFSKVADADISNINVPTGVPLVYELDEHFEPTRDYYYLDPDLAKRGIEKVLNEGKSSASSSKPSL